MVARENTLGATNNIACGGEEVKKGQYEVEGLIVSLVAVGGKEGEEWKIGREKALAVMWNISAGGAEVKRVLQIPKSHRIA